MIVFKSIKEMVNWLIDNDGKQLADNYGRRWKFEEYKFRYREIGLKSQFVDGLQCVHLYNTDLHIIKSIKSGIDLID